MHDLVSVLVGLPRHGSPPFWGTGFVHVLLYVSVWTPWLQVLLHADHIPSVLYDDQPPFTAKEDVVLVFEYGHHHSFATSILTATFLLLNRSIYGSNNAAAESLPGQVFPPHTPKKDRSV